MAEIWYPERDGIDHINIYSKGKTELGRWMTNFAYSPFASSRGHGQFASVEGFWYWLSSGEQHDHMRHLFGAEAKVQGKMLERVDRDETMFNREILFAINDKLRAHPEWQKKLSENSLPFAHYYVYNGAVKQAGYEWITEHWERIRRKLQE